MNVFLRCCWLALLLAQPAMMVAQESLKPVVEVSASASSVAVGDAITVVVSWSWPTGTTPISEPDPAQDFRECFITDVPPLVATRTAEGERRSQRLTLAAARSGAWGLPRPSLTVSTSNGPLTVQAPAVIVQVGTEAAPPRLPAPTALRIRPPAGEALTRHREWLVAAAAGVVVTSIAAWWWWRRRVSAAQEVPPGQQFAAAMSALAVVADRPDEPRGKEFAAGLSLALRRYAGQVWRFDGAGSTTREVAARLAHAAHDDERRDLLRLLERLDDQRWAAGSLSVMEVRPLADEAAAWVGAVERRRADEARAAADNRKAPATGAA